MTEKSVAIAQSKVLVFPVVKVVDETIIMGR
jgi:hypothetical protein